MNKTEIKITYIGGGSRQWAHMLMKDLALCGEISGDLVLYDIDQDAAEANTVVAEKIFSHVDAKTRFRCSAQHDLGKALDGADFVVCSIEPGPTEAREADLNIPDKYGVIQTVGDTCGPGGALRALRALPVYFEFARAIMKYCPDAWVINYTNPMTLCTGALYKAEPAIKAFGCCHEVFGTQELFANRVHKWFGVDVPERHEIILDITGVNHFTWATAAHYKNHDLMERLREEMAEEGYYIDQTDTIPNRIKKEEWFGAPNMVARDLLYHFGALGAAGDRHLVEFVPYYLQSRENLYRYGVIETPYEHRIKKAREKMASKGEFDVSNGLSRSGEEGVAQIRALLGLDTLRTNVNLPNRGQVNECDSGAIVESYCLMSRDRVEPIVSGKAPESVARLIHRVSSIQQSILNACYEQDSEAVYQALLTDPLMSKILPMDAKKMWGEMIAKNRPWLPDWV